MTAALHARTVGVVGTGTMGGAIVKRLVASGWDVVAHDATAPARQEAAEAGASVVSSAAAVAERASVALVAVFDDEQVSDAVNGPLGLCRGRPDGLVVAVHSTVAPWTARSVAERMTRGSALVDAAMTGGRGAVLEGRLTLVVGGDDEAVEQCRPAFSCYAARVLHAGGVGAGMTAKLAHNGVLHGNRLALYEGLRLAVAGGVAPGTFLDLVRAGAAASWVAEHWDELDAQAFAEGLGPHQLIDQLKKDLQLVQAVSSYLGLEAAVARRALDDLPDVLEHGVSAGARR